MNNSETTEYIKMDYSLETPEERVKKVEEIIANTSPEKLKSVYLDKLATYILDACEDLKKEKCILTDGHMVSVKRRETSFEGLVTRFENNENTGDAIYNMIANDKNIIFYHYKKIGEEEYDEIPGLRELANDIAVVEAQAKAARGKRAYLLRHQAIEMRKDQYELRKAYKPQSLNCINVIKTFSKIDFSENITLNEKGEIESDGIITFFNPKHISALLSNFEKLETSNWANVQNDAKWVLEDLQELIERTFAEKPILLEVTKAKMHSLSNAEIQELLMEKFNTSYSAEYLSFLWKNKIPKMIVETAEEDWLNWHFTEEERGYWKKCSRCGKIKLGINRFFSKNSSSKDHLYSICKECRNKKG